MKLVRVTPETLHYIKEWLSDRELRKLARSSSRELSEKDISDYLDEKVSWTYLILDMNENGDYEYVGYARIDALREPSGIGVVIADPKNRHKRLGTIVTRQLINIARGLKKVWVTATTTSYNIAAMQALESLGFDIYSVEKNAIDIDGKSYHKILYQKEIE
jgi:RimJ/RimL family protein N-acetyltransferase